MALPVYHLPYYEGFNKAGESSWLGIYRRDELFPVNFLREVCSICLNSKIGQFYTTSWKSIIIKGILDAERKNWDHILGTYRINVRHAANELNWQVEDNNEDGLILKRHVIRHFDIEDVRTYGLNFAVKTRNSPGIFGSVIINKQLAKNNARLKSMDRFEIMHTRDFNPNSTDLVSFRKDVVKEHLGTYLVSLCKLFYEQRNNGSDKDAASSPPLVPELLQYVYQCSHCLTTYDETTGEPENNIKAGTGFFELTGYTCPLCEAAKDDFIKVDKRLLSEPLMDGAYRKK